MGEIGPSVAKTSIPFLCAAVVNFLTVLLYTHSTTIIAKIYTPDSATYSLRLQQKVYMPYMTGCGAFDLAMHYSIYPGPLKSCSVLREVSDQLSAPLYKYIMFTYAIKILS